MGKKKLLVDSIQSDSPHNTERVMRAVMVEKWAITPEAMEQIVTIAARENDHDWSAVSAKMGKPMDFTRNVTVRDGVAIVPVSGPIFRYANLLTEFSGATSIDVMARDFNAALNDPMIDSIILDIDSPGGQVTGTNEFADMVYGARGVKPVIAYINGMGASAAYWIASGADKVVMDATALAGSIGVVTTMHTGKNNSYIEVVSSQSPDKRVDINTDDGRAKVQATVDDLANVFIEIVARNRGVSKDTVLTDFGQGGVMVGVKAIEAGLADELGSLESLIAGLSGSSKGVISMADKANTDQPVITRETIAAEHPAIAEAFREEGAAGVRDEARTEGASAERERIQGVFEQGKGLPGHGALVEKLMFDGKSGSGDAAVAILKADKALSTNALKDRVEDAPLAVNQPDPDSSAIEDDDAPIEDRCKAAWSKDKKLRAEFGGDFDSYLGFERADANGQVKQLNK